jgi:hypothetical protein
MRTLSKLGHMNHSIFCIILVMTNSSTATIVGMIFDRESEYWFNSNLILLIYSSKDS